jgi:hypothetical protein
MAFLAEFKAVSATRPSYSSNINPIATRRTKLAEAIDSQLLLLSNEGKQVQRVVMGENGKPVRQPKKWYWMNGKVVMAEIRYGSRVLQFGKNNAFEVANLKAAVAFYTKAQVASLAGEFDHELEVASKRSPKKQ